MHTLWEQAFDASPDVLKHAAEVRLALFDVDGVLTDGGLRFTADGEQVKVFNVLDGHGIKMLLGEDVEVGIITARDSAAVRRRVDELGIRHYYSGQHDKTAAFEELLESLAVAEEHCAYMGDDVIDLPVMRRCGLAMSVANAHPVVKQIADWIAPAPGGGGAVRWACDLILYAQNKYNRLMTSYLA